MPRLSEDIIKYTSKKEFRGFQKIRFDQFTKDVTDAYPFIFNENNINDLKDLYIHFEEPQRATINSAGYDFFALQDFNLRPGESHKFPTGIKSFMPVNQGLFMFVRSSYGFKYNVRLVNQIGLIDSDYYNNPINDGHIWVKLENHGDKALKINRGDAIAQGVFLEVFRTHDDKPKNVQRTSGIGSTSKK